MAFSPELEAKLTQVLEVLENNGTAVLIFDDMFEINERFQATLEWFKDRGRKLRRRYGTGAFMKGGGVIYFVGADTWRQTRGAELELDLREHQDELVRQKGLEARLREKGLAS